MPPRQRQDLDRVLKARVHRAYQTPGSAVAYSTPSRVAEHFNIPVAKAKRFLEELEGYTLHREYKKPFLFNPYYVHNRRKQVQGDLIDISSLAADNDGVKFLLVLIDIFTKKLWVYSMTNKSANTTKAAMADWLRSLDVPPELLVTDYGTEFTNRAVQALLRSRGVTWRGAHGTLKACFAERVNKTLQVLIFKYLTDNEETRYVDVLNRLVGTYNKRKHRTLKGLSPDEADRPENERQVQATHHARYAEIQRRAPKKDFKFQVGDIVRLKILPRKLGRESRAYAQQFKGEYFKVYEINRTFPVPLYKIQSLDTDEKIAGGLYANELVRQRGEVYKVERVIRRRTVRGQREIFVKWEHFGPRHNSWIPAANVARVYRRP